MAWNGSNVKEGETTSVEPAKKSPVRGLVAGLVVCAGAGVALWLVSGRNEPSAKPTDEIAKPSKIAEVAHVVATNTTVETAIPQLDPAKRYEDGVEVVSASVRTNSSGAVIEKLVLANGKKMSKIHPPKPVFENPCDQVIALAISTKPGQSMPPLPALDKSLEKEFLDSLTNPFRIEETDSEKVREIKAMVLEAKAYIADEIKKGGTVLGAIQAHQKMMEETADAHLAAIQMMQKIKAEDGKEAAEEFVSRVNESFRARGIVELELTNTNKENRE